MKSSLASCVAVSPPSILESYELILRNLSLLCFCGSVLEFRSRFLLQTGHKVAEGIDMRAVSAHSGGERRAVSAVAISPWVFLLRHPATRHLMEARGEQPSLWTVHRADLHVFNRAFEHFLSFYRRSQMWKRD